MDSITHDFLSSHFQASYSVRRRLPGNRVRLRLSYFRFRTFHSKPADPVESLTALRVLAIPEKNGETEYEVDAQNPEQTITCVHSFFPHSGYSPCWYVKPRINQPIPM